MDIDIYKSVSDMRKIKTDLIIILLLCANITFAQSVSYAKSLIEQGKYLEAAKQLRPLADGGNAEAQAIASYLFFEGKGVQKNEQQGLKYATLAADQGHEGGISNLCNYYEKKGDRKKAISIAKNYTDKFPQLLKGHLGWILGERYVYGENRENEDRGWEILTAHPYFKDNLENNDYLAQAYWGYQMRKSGYKDLLQYMDYLYGSGQNSMFKQCIHYAEKSYGGKEDALMHYQSLANGGNNYAAALLVWYEIEKNPGRYVNVSSIKQMISQIDYKQSKIGSAIYSEWGNLPCVGDKRAGGTIYSLNYGTHDINIMTDLIRCKYKDRFNVIESKNASSPVRWRLARANEIEYMLANSQTTGVRIVTYENYWILDGTYKWVTGQAKITKISEQILPNTTGAMVLVAEDKF